MMSKKVRIEFNRGNNERFISDTSSFALNENGKAVIDFEELPFICNSSFFVTKKGEFKEKICEFKLMLQDDTNKGKFKPLAAKKYNMSQILNDQPDIRGES